MPIIRSMLVGLLLLSGVAIGVAGFYADIYTTYLSSSNVDVSALTANSQTQNLVSQIRQSVETKTQGTTGAGFFFIATGIFDSIRLTIASLDIFSTLINTAVVGLGLPSWLIGIVFTVVTIVIVFEVISTVTGRKF